MDILTTRKTIPKPNRNYMGRSRLELRGAKVATESRIRIPNTDLEDEMKYQILLESHYGMRTINSLRVI